jgi:hypothetical protein
METLMPLSASTDSVRSILSGLGQVVRIASLTLFVFASGSVLAQETRCTTKLNELPRAPELKNFWLGMTQDQVKSVVPQIVFGPTDALGTTKTTINPSFDARTDKSMFQDVRTISFDFLDGRLVSLWIGYDRTFKWTTIDDFVKGVSQSLLLPNSWSAWKSRGQQMRCADFQLTVSMVAGSPSFRLLDQTAAETLTARRVAKDEEESAAEETSQEADQIFGDSQARIYYPSSCRPTKEIVEANLVIFKTRTEAEKAGFKQAKGCQ